MIGILKNIKNERHPEESIDLTSVKGLKMKLQNRSQIFNFLTPVIYICGNPAVKLFAALIAVAVFFTFTTSVFAAIAVEDSDHNTTTSATLTISSFPVQGANRLMMVGVSINNDNYEYVTGITWNGSETFTYLTKDNTSDDAQTEIWYLKNPTATTANVVVTFNEMTAAAEAIAGVVTYTGADLSAGNTFRDYGSLAWAAAQPSITVNSEIGDMVFGVVAAEYQDIFSTTADDPHWEYDTFSGGGGTWDGEASSTTVSWTLDSTDHTAISAASIKPASVNSPPSAPQNTAEYYEIEVDTAATFDGTRMWDTGKTALTSLAENTRMPDTSYAGTALGPGATYYWRIRFWDDSDAQGAWSAGQQFTMSTNSVVEVWVSQGSDDAEEYKSNGNMYVGSSDLELVDEDGITPQWVGMRFNNITVPQGATITNAYVQFTADVTNSGDTDLTVYGQDADNVTSGFTSTAYNISSRSRLGTTVSWENVPAWDTSGEQDVDQRTPDISSIIQLIVNKGGWSSGNSLVIIIDGTVGSEREAESYEGANGHSNLTLAPYIHIEYSSGNSAPSAPQTPYCEGVTNPADVTDIRPSTTRSRWIPQRPLTAPGCGIRARRRLRPWQKIRACRMCHMPARRWPAAPPITGASNSGMTTTPKAPGAPPRILPPGRFPPPRIPGVKIAAAMTIRV
jgi:hypothetical protein